MEYGPAVAGPVYRAAISPNLQNCVIDNIELEIVIGSHCDFYGLITYSSPDVDAQNRNRGPIGRKKRLEAWHRPCLIVLRGESVLTRAFLGKGVDDYA